MTSARLPLALIALCLSAPACSRREAPAPPDLTMRPHRYMRDTVLAQFDDAWRDIFDDGAVTVYSIDPSDKKAEDAEQTFQGYRILGSVAVGDAAQATDVRRVLARSVTVDEGSLCFSPRHAVRFVRRRQRLDFLICYECTKVYAFVDGDMWHGTDFVIDTTSKPLLNQLLTAAHVPLAPEGHIEAARGAQ